MRYAVAPNTVSPPSGWTTVTTGGVVSRTVTWKPRFGVPPASVAEHVTVVVSSANVEPESGLQVVGRDLSIASEVVVVYVATVFAALVASSVMSAGTVTDGGVLSKTVIASEALPVQPSWATATSVCCLGAGR
jgi:hypothetical protein